MAKYIYKDELKKFGRELIDMTIMFGMADQGMGSLCGNVFINDHSKAVTRNLTNLGKSKIVISMRKVINLLAENITVFVNMLINGKAINILEFTSSKVDTTIINVNTDPHPELTIRKDKKIVLEKNEMGIFIDSLTDTLLPIIQHRRE